MRRKIWQIEIILYLLIGLSAGYFLGGEKNYLSLSAYAFFVYLAYFFLSRIWRAGGFVERAALLFATAAGGALLLFGLGDLIRALAFFFYEGEEPVYFVFAGLKRKGSSRDSSVSGA